MLIQSLLRDHDKLKAFELHPTDSRLLAVNFDELDAGRQIAMFAEDGFEGIKRFIPPSSRRALVLTDPSYEVKSDYLKVICFLARAMLRTPLSLIMAKLPNTLYRPYAYRRAMGGIGIGWHKRRRDRD